MHPVMARLAQDHARLTQVLNLLDGLLDRFHEGTEPDYELINELLEYMDNYADVVHHPTEELIFQRVLELGTDRPDIFEVLTRQHAGLSQVTKRFRTSIEGILNEEVLLREDVEANGRELVATNRGHMILEDSEAFPIALQALSEDDWDAIQAAAPVVEDPVFGNPDPQRFKALFKQLYAETQDSPAPHT
ncbi:hemerythrin domain-containing protein [Thiocystis violacea]|uniref:hemerythrin domain-containing protein n=1 Tax=Thiocystis violacea TaxID=13725 RepID=UPI0019071030|nr:hemerythrin domain-containing protein [Thiocystis violacea]MBK1721110.1 cation-binding protein [Thiocystis violacea]